jgi:cobalt-zinc-cadmium efflux system outer membrane protein
VACLLTASAAAHAQGLALADLLALARARAPAIVSARLAIEEARGRLAGASLRVQANPEIDFSAGRRTGPEGRSADFGVGVSQALELPSRRSARVAGATAAIAQGTANAEVVTTRILRDTASAYYRVVHASERIALLDAAQALASTIHATATRRFEAGDIAVLDVNVARAALARVRADREAAEAAKVLALGELRALLGVEDLTIVGSLAVPPSIDLQSALQSAGQRPELAALEAAVREADADQRYSASLAKPQFSLGARYAHEEGDRIVLGGLTVSLPLFSTGQEQLAVSAARVARLRAELDAASARVRIEVRSAFEAFTRRLAAVRALEADATSSLDENEHLTARSFEAGQIGLPDLLLIRREILDTRLQHLDALREAALARIDLDASAAILR